MYNYLQIIHLYKKINVSQEIRLVNSYTLTKILKPVQI